MRRKSIIFLVVVMLMLVATFFVACDKNNNDSTEPQEQIVPGEYESATYTVTYDANGGTTNSSWKTKTYTFGDAILKPTYTPIKSGYIFLYWSTSKTGTSFDFLTSSIEADTTLYAVYQAATTQHNYDLTAVLVKDGEDNYSVQTDSYTYGEMPSGSTVISTQYGNASSPIATAITSNPTKVNGISDYFLFWYYLDSDNKPVRFTTIATSTSTSVTPLKGYTSSESLTLYPMWLSTLPKIVVKFKDTKSELVYNTVYGYYNDILDKSENPIQAKSGYDFKEWTYTDKDEKEQKFFFNDDDDETVEATIVSDMVDYNYFDELSVTVYANWTRSLTISATSSYDSYYQLLRKENPNEEEQKEIEEFLSANIEFTSLDFSGYEFEPLFDKDHIFTGSIVGNNAGNKAEFINCLFKGSSNVSMFGYVSGEIKNISIVNATYQIETDSSDSLIIGGIVSYLLTKDGFIFDCVATMTIAYSGYKEIIIGGIVGENNGTVQKCDVTVSSCSISAEDICFGGIAGKNKSSSAALENKASLNIDSITSTKTFRFGGITAINSGSISTSKAIVTLDSLSSIKTIGFGGIAAENTSLIDQCVAQVTMGNNVDLVTVGGLDNTIATIGGAIGHNDGQLKNSYSILNINLSNTSNGDVIYLGGLVGNNESTSTSSTAGAIVNSYSKGSLKLSVGTDKNSTTYVGGIAGKNKQNGIVSIFTDLNIEVENVNGTNKVGYLLGENSSTSNITIAYVSNTASLTKNGTSCTLLDRETITVLLNEKEQPYGNLCTIGVITGSASGCMNWDDEIWTITEEEVVLPTLIWEA